MNKKTLFTTLILVIIIISTLYYYYSINNNETLPNAQGITYQENGSFHLVGTYKELFDMNTELYCTYSQNSEVGEIIGTHYIQSKENNLNQLEMKQTGNDFWFKLSALMKDGKLYTWGDTQPEGEGSIRDFEMSPQSLELIYTFDCIQQKIGDNYLSPPNNIIFDNVQEKPQTNQ